MNNPTPGPIKASPADAERIIQLTAEVDERIAQAEAAVGDPDLVAQLQAERDERIGELASSWVRRSAS